MGSEWERTSCRLTVSALPHPEVLMAIIFSSTFIAACVDASNIFSRIWWVFSTKVEPTVESRTLNQRIVQCKCYEHDLNKYLSVHKDPCLRFFELLRLLQLRCTVVHQNWSQNNTDFRNFANSGILSLKVKSVGWNARQVESSLCFWRKKHSRLGKRSHRDGREVVWLSHRSIQ